MCRGNRVNWIFFARNVTHISTWTGKRFEKPSRLKRMYGCRESFGRLSLIGNIFFQSTPEITETSTLSMCRGNRVNWIFFARNVTHISTWTGKRFEKPSRLKRMYGCRESFGRLSLIGNIFFQSTPEIKLWPAKQFCTTPQVSSFCLVGSMGTFTSGYIFKLFDLHLYR